ncbi:MAG: hypothetical protein E5Y31_18960 [Mesorhizobium sp.]|nr:MAG: hypothetical protein E5Y31_18960 [Mesorhizobium sp.]
MLGTIRAFWNDQRGVAMILVAIMLPVIVGFALLVIDLSRANSLHNDLQKGADAFALAAAAELDGRTDAIIRGNRAIDNLLANESRFSTSGTHTLARQPDLTVTFLSGIPANDSTALNAYGIDANGTNWATTDPKLATFVEVTVNPTGFATMFPASVLSGNSASNSMNIGSTAVAGNAGATVCSMVPTFICNPYPGQDLNQIASSGNLLRKSLKLVAGGNNWGPGNIGFLRPKDSHGYGETELATDIAIGQVPECVNTRLIYTQTGTLSNKVTAGFNTRFDLYGNGNGFPSKNDSRWPPAPNVRKGYKTTGSPSSCNSTLQADTTKFRGLTPDLAFSGQIGNGSWDYDGYVSVNKLAAGLAGFKDANGNAYTNANPPSRYDLYKYEIDHNLVGTASIGGETGTPGCAPTTGGIDRRLFQAAIVDCSSQAVVDQLRGQSGAVPAMGFASVFLTESVANGEVRAEIVDINGTLGRGTLANRVRDEVQLYR